MTRFEMIGKVVAIVEDHFYVRTGGGVLRIPIKQYQDRPKEGAQVTIAVEVS